MSSATPIALKVGGVAYTRFEGIRVSTGIEQLAGDYELHCADGWAIRGVARPVLPGLPASIEIAGTPVITGFIDDSEPNYDEHRHDLTIRGRDATGDLVDCAAAVDGQGWEGRTLDEVAKDLCKPFGIPVAVLSDDGPAYAGSIFKKKPRGLSSRDPFRTTRINPGETVFEVLSRASKLRGALLVSDRVGGLIITRAGSTRAKTKLKRGVNILGGRALHSHRERFHTYKVFGQGNAFYTMADPSAAQQVLSTAIDPSIRAQRVTAIVTSDDSDPGLAQQVAVWARANAAAIGERGWINVRGWLDGETPWRENTVVSIDDDYLGLQGNYLIAGVTYLLDDRHGEVSRLTVTPPEAYVPMPEKEYDPSASVGFTP